MELSHLPARAPFLFMPTAWLLDADDVADLLHHDVELVADLDLAAPGYLRTSHGYLLAGPRRTVTKSPPTGLAMTTALSFIAEAPIAIDAGKRWLALRRLLGACPSGTALSWLAPPSPAVSAIRLRSLAQESADHSSASDRMR